MTGFGDPVFGPGDPKPAPGPRGQPARPVKTLNAAAWPMVASFGSEACGDAASGIGYVVNEEKSGIRQPRQVHFLGFRFQCRQGRSSKRCP
jgi:hypothetical protein